MNLDIAMMQKAQVFLREDQKIQLQALAKLTGRKQSELIRRGVDMAIEEAKKTQANWRDGWSHACGIWKDREDIDSLLTDYRAEMDSRIDTLQR